MTELGPEIERAVRVDWSPTRARAGEVGLRLRRRRRAVARVALGVAAVLALVAGGAWAAWSARSRRATPPIASGTGSGSAPAPTVPSTTLRFDDGSTASPLASGGELRLAAVQPGRVTVELVAGGGHFHVVADRARVFRVIAGPITVETFGATFACSRVEMRVRVDVIEGTVRVLWGDQQRELVAGDGDTFPPAAVPAPPPPIDPAPPPVDPPRPPVRAARAVEPTWRDLARDGDYDQAYAALERAGAPSVRDEPDELLLAADVKRLSHHPAEAVAPLRRILRDHADDPRAPLAAFTLGRVLLEELGLPADAADAFAQAERLAPDGPMAEDAVARGVEALSRAGDATAARHLAESYVARFPAGRKLRLVKRFGGLE